MTTTTIAAAQAPQEIAGRLFGAARSLSERFSPTWFTPVMGTAIIAIALTSLPLAGTVTADAAAAAWILGASVLVIVCLAWTMQAVWHPRVAASHHHDPVRAHSYGAPAMAFMAVGAGAYLAGRPLLPAHVALAVFVALWCIGSAIGVAAAIAVPYIMFTRHTFAPEEAHGGWLLPVVAPMVTASTGALLIDHVPSGQARLAFTLALVAMFGASLFASVIVTTQIWSRLMHRSVPAAAIVPTAWIVLGFLGQSTTATSALADHGASVVSSTSAALAPRLAVLYGIPTMGFAMLWLAIAALLARHAAKRGLPFTLSWWSFTFPVGTCVTGFSALAAHTGSDALAALALALFCGLVTGWCVTSVHTVGAARRRVLSAWATS